MSAIESPVPQPRSACVARSGGRASAVQGYSVGLAAKVAVASVRSSVQEFATIQEAVFCCFSTADVLHANALAEAGHEVQIFLLGEAVSLMRDPVANAVVPVGWPPLAEALRTTVALGTPIHV